jgi:4-amino-4-deoxy-L-arabinose transferase-like glycosyltransferase
MSAFRNPLLPVGLLLVILGCGNWYTGVDKGREYEVLLAAGHLRTNITDFEEFHELNARTNATLLSPIQRGSDEMTFANAKLDFYKVVQSGGRILILAGLFCAAAGLIHAWYRQRQVERGLVPHGAQ